MVYCDLANDVSETVWHGFAGHLAFSGSIRDNIAMGGKMLVKLRYWLQLITHADPSSDLAGGYDTLLDDEASNISGPEAIADLANAFLADPEILILDEATSSVDTRTEILIQAAMAKLMQERTSFVIAHRLSTIRNADTILVMDNGRIVEQGSHDQLMADRGFYYDLYRSQFLGAYDAAI